MARVGFAVMRIQPLSDGHRGALNRIAGECETAIIAIGSTQAPMDIYNPWSFEQRKEMVRNVYGDRFKIVPVTDLGTDSTTTDWCEYVLGKLEKLGLPAPTDYYTGSVADAIWYRKHFFTPEEIKAKLKLDGREYEVNSMDVYPRLHILNRETTIYPPATDIRTFLRLKSDEWKQWVPRVNHKLVESTFPKELITG